MDQVADILKSIRERISNPLIFSFIVSWLIFNWEISIALLWFSGPELNESYGQSIFEFISSRICWENTLMHPLLTALGYTFLVPILKNIINAFYAWNVNWGENWNLRISKGSKIDIDKYFSLEAKYQKKSKNLEEIISRERETINQLETTINALHESRKQTLDAQNKASEAIESLGMLTNVSILNGKWIFKKRLILTEGIEEERIEIKDGEITIDKFDNPKRKFRIRNFYYDHKHKNITFIKIPTKIKDEELPPSPVFYLYELRFDLNSLTGRENSDTEVSFIRETFITVTY